VAPLVIIFLSALFSVAASFFFPRPTSSAAPPWAQGFPFLFLVPPSREATADVGCSAILFTFLVFLLSAGVFNSQWLVTGAVSSGEGCWKGVSWGSRGGDVLSHFSRGESPRTRMQCRRFLRCNGTPTATISHPKPTIHYPRTTRVPFWGRFCFMLLIWQFQLHWQLAFPQTPSIAFNGRKLIVAFPGSSLDNCSASSFFCEDK